MVQGEMGYGEDTQIIRVEGEFIKVSVTVDYEGTWMDRGPKAYSVDDVLFIGETVELTPEQKGAVECLWDIFGGTTTEQGYKVLHERIGLIYGDSITLARLQAINERLMAKGFATTNVVKGVGSFTSQYMTRDSLGMAIKATWTQVNGKGYDIFKDPVTDIGGVKKSAKGRMRVELENGDYVMYDQQTAEKEARGELKEVFRDGKILIEHTLSEIRNRVWA